MIDFNQRLRSGVGIASTVLIQTCLTTLLFTNETFTYSSRLHPEKVFRFTVAWMLLRRKDGNKEIILVLRSLHRDLAAHSFVKQAGNKLALLEEHM